MFGHIKGVSVGQIFSSRKEVAEAKIHTPWWQGISNADIPGGQRGTCSIIVSGGSENNIDYFDYILYAGEGGRGHGGEQIAEQKLTARNLGLKLSCQYRLPVRVVRGYKASNGPENGYRYDGLYYVEHFEYIKGRRGFYIYRFHLVSEYSIDQLEDILRPNLKSDYIRPPNRSQTTINRLQRKKNYS